MKKLIFIFMASLAFAIFTTPAYSGPVINSKQFLYLAGNDIPSLDNPVSGYYDISQPKVTCVDTGKDDNCVPTYNFYALSNGYTKDPLSGKLLFRQTLNMQSLNFWGGAGENYPNCSIISEAPTSSTTEAPQMSNAYNFTRVGYVINSSYRWAPKPPGTMTCPTDKLSGNTFTIFTKGTDKTGLGMFTMSGKASNEAFWRGYTAIGQDGKGNNAFISGTFFAFLQNPDKKNGIKVFSGDSTDPNLRRVRIDVKESVYISQTAGDKTKIAQVIQYLDVVLWNTDCLTQRAASPTLMCQFEIQLIPYINRREYAKDAQGNYTDPIPTETLPFYQNAAVFFDPIQGGNSVINGPLKDKGQTTNIVWNNKSYPVWTSRGTKTQFKTATVPTQAGPDGLVIPEFENLPFIQEISWQQWETYLRILAAMSYQKMTGVYLEPAQVSDVYMDSKFGVNWRDPNVWIVGRIAAAQEAYNPNQETETIYVGGNFKRVNVQAMP